MAQRERPCSCRPIHDLALDGAVPNAVAMGPGRMLQGAGLIFSRTGLAIPVVRLPGTRQRPQPLNQADGRQTSAGMAGNSNQLVAPRPPEPRIDLEGRTSFSQGKHSFLKKVTNPQLCACVQWTIKCDGNAEKQEPSAQ